MKGTVTTVTNPCCQTPPVEPLRSSSRFECGHVEYVRQHGLVSPHLETSLTRPGTDAAIISTRVVEITSSRRWLIILLKTLAFPPNLAYVSRPPVATHAMGKSTASIAVKVASLVPAYKFYCCHATTAVGVHGRAPNGSVEASRPCRT